MKILFSIIIYLPIFCIGQKQGNIWYFGNHAGVDFNTGMPVAITNGATYFPTGSYLEGTTTICDSAGNLLFYSDGQKLWNSNHQVTPNGDSLFGNFSATQSSIIVPQPQSSRYFYLFTVDDIWEHQLQYGFRYSIIDLCLNNGFGDVVVGSKNILLVDTVGEKVAATLHANGVDYWILTHKLYSDAFYAYKLTPNGILDTVITHIGSVALGAQGQLKFSPSGNKIAISSGQSFAQPCYFELFDFDNSTGIISNQISLVMPLNSVVYGVEFSPDNLKLYGTYGSPSPFGMGIVQYDLSSGIQTAINSSMNTVYQNLFALTIRGLQLGPDYKIYQVGTNGYLTSINLPNNYGTACSVIDTAVYLLGQNGSDGLPSFIAGYSYSNNTYNCSNSIDEHANDNSITAFPNPFSNQITLIAKNNDQLFVSLHDILGQEILQQGFKNSTTINTEQLTDGIYFYELRSNNSIIGNGKIVKQ